MQCSAVTPTINLAFQALMRLALQLRILMVEILTVQCKDRCPTDLSLQLAAVFVSLEGGE